MKLKHGCIMLSTLCILSMCLFGSFGAASINTEPINQTSTVASQAVVSTSPTNNVASTPTPSVPQTTSQASNTTKQPNVPKSNEAAKKPVKTENNAAKAPSSKTVSTPSTSSSSNVSVNKYKSSNVSSEAESEVESDTDESSMILPDVADEEVSMMLGLVSTIEAPKNNNNIWLGIISCAFIGIGIAIVLSVIFTNRRRGSNKVVGHKRYRKNKNKNNKKFSSNYYRNIHRK